MTDRDYSDETVASATAEDLYDVINKYSEDEIPAAIAKDARYSVNSVFSPVRRNLLEWYPFRNDCTVLEINPGKGALTGVLCDHAKHVTVLEPSESNCDFIKCRYRDRENLTVLLADVSRFETQDRYDYAVMADVTVSTAYSLEDLIAKAKTLLKPDGVMLIALNNRFGLKYWIGGTDVSAEKPFAGMQVGYSKAAVEDICGNAGLQTRFYYLMPDACFPTAVFTDQHLPTYHDLQFLRYAYTPEACLVSKEQELYRDVLQNEVFPFFANAYLVEISANLPQGFVTRVSARSEVVSDKRILTVIDNRGNVLKIPQTKQAQKHLEATYQNECALRSRGVRCLESEFDGVTIRSAFCDKRMANEVFEEALQNGDLQTVKEMIDALKAALCASSGLCEGEDCNEALQALGGAQDEPVLLHGYMDMTFYNAFWSDDTLIFFDQEWDFFGLPVSFILYYGLKICYGQTLSAPKIPFTALCDYIGVSDEMSKRYDLLEGKLWNNGFVREGDLYGADRRYLQYGILTFDRLQQEHTKLKETVEEQKAFLAHREEELRFRDAELQKHLQIIRDKESQIQKTEERVCHLQEDVRSKDEHIDSLQEDKRKLEAIYSSRVWRFASKLSRIYRFFVPSGSKRELLLRMLTTLVRHPVKFCRSLTPRKLKKFFRMLGRGDIAGLGRVMHTNITGEPMPSSLETVKPAVMPVDEAASSMDDYPCVTVPQWESPLVSIVIPVYNQFAYTYQCIASIVRNSGDVSYEIIVADDCSDDLTTQMESILPGVIRITGEKTVRFLHNCNNAAKHARGKYLLFLNNDTQVQQDWLKPLVTLIESAADIGMVGSKLIYPDGRLQEAGGILWRDASVWNYGIYQNPAQPEFNYVRQVDYISGASIMIKRDLWEQIGGFDERFAPAYCEDSDLAFTVRKMGYRVMYQPQSVVVHFEGVSNGTDTSSGLKKYQVENMAKFREKWAEELSRHPENGEDVFHARDYSYGKKTLLMIDHYVPQFDKDAGSRTVFQYLKMFVEQGFNVKFIGDNFYQHEPYTTVLQQMGIEVLYGPDYAAHWKDWIRENRECIDYVFLNRPHIAPKYLEFIRQNTKAKIMYYGHDLAFLREMREFEITGDASFRDSSLEWQPKELALMRSADMAYYPSYVEVDEIQAIDPDIRVKAIPAYLFENVKWEGYDIAGRKDIMFIGGFDHRPNVDAVKWLANEILPELLKYLPDIKIHILGSNAPKDVLELASEHLIIEGFVTDEQLEAFYRNSRIALVPLRYGAGIKGKVVEAMRYGTPVVTTSTGAEGISNAQEVMVVEDDALVLAKRIAELYTDADKLTAMSKNSIAYIQDNYSYNNAIAIIGPEFDLC